MDKHKLFLDMDNTIADFAKLYYQELSEMNPYPQSREGFFLDLEPFPNMVEVIHKLSEVFDIWILTRPSIFNKHCYTEKAQWIEKYFGRDQLERMIIAPDKSMIIGDEYDILIDDFDEHGQPEFGGHWIKYDNTTMPWSKYKEWLNVHENIPLDKCPEEWLDIQNNSLKYVIDNSHLTYDDILKADDVRTFIHYNDSRYPSLVINGTYNFGLSFDAHTLEFEPPSCICCAWGDDFCICDI